MTYDEAVKLSEELKTRLNGAFSSSDKVEIERLYGQVLQKQFKRTSCRRCYHDALIEIILYLRKEKRMRTPSNYALRAGFIIHCPNFHSGKIYTNDNLTDEIAAEYLQQYPNQRAMFARVPALNSAPADAPKTDEPNTAPTDNKKPSKRKKTKK